MKTPSSAAVCRTVVTVLGVAFFASIAAAQLPVAEADADASAKFGTAVNWVTEPRQAVRKAREQSKLVFMMHLSGDFTNSDST